MALSRETTHRVWVALAWVAFVVLFTVRLDSPGAARVFALVLSLLAGFFAGRANPVVALQFAKTLTVLSAAGLLLALAGVASLTGPLWQLLLGLVLLWLGVLVGGRLPQRATAHRWRDRVRRLGREGFGFMVDGPRERE